MIYMNMFLNIYDIDCQCQLFLPQKMFWVWISLCLVVAMTVKMAYWRLWIFPFSHSLKILIHTIQIREGSLLHLQYDLVLDYLYVDWLVCYQLTVCVLFDWICIYFLGNWFRWCTYICGQWWHIPCFISLWVADLRWILKSFVMTLVLLCQCWGSKHFPVSSWKYMIT